ncbi:MAG TPA: RNB domain-containing ribonuclease [Oligoflexia bacterium]|nr:RNB domain-containing ribonuclease [Oligoflexia bacterium]HMP48244.1 RNB domain-containing ribonuclease [Oligoflexia bacterium]
MKPNFLPNKRGAQKSNTQANKLLENNKTSSSNKFDNAINTGSIVEYEQHAEPILAWVSLSSGGKYNLVNEHGENISLPFNRLYFFDILLPAYDQKEIKSISSQIKKRAYELEAESLWKEAILNPEEASKETDKSSDRKSSSREFSLDELFFWSGLNSNPIEIASFRRMLILDTIYFKRSKSGFIPRTEEEVARSKEVKSETLREESNKLALRLAIQKRLAGDLKAPLPQSVSALEDLAASGRKSPSAKVYQGLIDDLFKVSGLEQKKKMTLEERAFQLLVKIGHFSPNENLIPLRIGRPVDFSSDERTEAERLFQIFKKEDITDRTDLSHLEAFTIDSESSSDFDDAISLHHEDGNIIAGVHISDSSYRILPDSILESTAFRRATSIYCPDQTIPMLPPTLSEGVLSLKEGIKRPCVSFMFRLNNDLEIESRKIIPSLIVVKERMTYEGVDEILCDGKNHPRASVLEKLWDIASHHETLRIEKGSIQFSRRDLIPEIRPNGKIKLVINNDDTPARKLISELAIIANETAALYAVTNSIPFIFRSQERPDGNIEEIASSIMEGPAREFFKRGLLKRSLTSLTPGHHAGLGLQAYCQVTSPIRRALDMVLLRQLVSHLTSGSPCYSTKDIEKIMQETSQGLDEAVIIQKERNRFWLYKYIQQERLSNFTGTIVRADPPRPLIELDEIYSIHSYVPLKPLGNVPQPTLLGQRIKVEVKKIDPSQDIFYLHEAPNSE